MKEAKSQNQLEQVVQTAKKYNKKLEEAKQADSSSGMKRLVSILSENSGREAENIVSNGHLVEISIIENYIKNGQYVEALNLFRDKIIHILYEVKLLKVNGRYLKREGKKTFLNEDIVEREIMGVYCYYENLNSEKHSSKHNFMDTVHKYIELLIYNPKEEPKNLFQKHLGYKFYDLENYLDNAPKFGFAHNSYSREMAKKRVLPYLEKYQTCGVPLEKVLDRYLQLDRLYMNYGFPFACTYVNWFFDKYDEEYKKILENGIESLQKFYHGKVDMTIRKMKKYFPEREFTYEDLVHKLKGEELDKLLHILFPFRLIAKNISSDILNQDEWDEFIYNFSRSFYVIKGARNKAIHVKNLRM